MNFLAHGSSLVLSPLGIRKNTVDLKTRGGKVRVEGAVVSVESVFNGDCKFRILVGNRFRR